MQNIKHHSIPSDILFFLRYLKKEEPSVLWCCGAEIILRTLIPCFGIYLPKLTLDLLEQGVTTQRLLAVLGSFTILMMAVYALNGLISTGKHFFCNQQNLSLITELFLKSLRVRYKEIESGSGSQTLWNAYNSLTNGNWSSWSSTISSALNMTVNILCFILYSTVLGSLNIWLIFALLALSGISYLIGLYHIKVSESFRDAHALADKHLHSVKAVMGNPSAAKDVRIFHMQDWLLNLRNQALDEKQVVSSRMYRHNAVCGELNYLLTILRDLAAYAYLIWQAIHGNISVGEFVLYFGAITGFAGFVNGITESLKILREASNGTDYIRAFLALEEDDISHGTHHIAELTEPLEIEFDDVSFSYASSDHDNPGTPSLTVFSHFNLTIHAGETIALVGVNGAGKTTFVKLLCGMYEPDSGTIRINGIDIREFPKQELYRLFSVVFQEAFTLPFTVGENLAMTVSEDIDTSRAWKALEQAGLKEIFEEKQITLDTFMKKAVTKDGIDLSGGQMQRFLLARALYKNAPILLLDEPTASLDPIAESEVYDNYRRYSKGKTSVFISHRLASTRFSDRIVLIENGRILEIGTHDELMHKNGSYAAMFRIQSRYYTDSAQEV